MVKKISAIFLGLLVIGVGIVFAAGQETLTYDQINAAGSKEEFLKTLQEKYGSENKFYLSYEDEETKDEINPVTGKIRYTNKNTGTVEEFDAYDDNETEKIAE